MAITKDQLEALMHNHEMQFFQHSDGTAFYLPYGGFGVFVHILEDGEFLLLRSTSALGLKRLTTEQRHRLLERLMELQNKMKLGRFAIDENELLFEVGVSLEDGELTGRQFRRCLATVCHHVDELRNDNSITRGQAHHGSLATLIARLRSRRNAAGG